MREVWQKLGIRRQPPEMGVGFESLWGAEEAESIIQEDIDEMSDEMLGFNLVRFVAEVRKEDGQEYPGK